MLQVRQSVGVLCGQRGVPNPVGQGQAAVASTLCGVRTCMFVCASIGPWPALWPPVHTRVVEGCLGCVLWWLGSLALMAAPGLAMAWIHCYHCHHWALHLQLRLAVMGIACAHRDSSKARLCCTCVVLAEGALCLSSTPARHRLHSQWQQCCPPLTLQVKGLLAALLLLQRLPQCCLQPNSHCICGMCPHQAPNPVCVVTRRNSVR